MSAPYSDMPPWLIRKTSRRLPAKSLQFSGYEQHPRADDARRHADKRDRVGVVLREAGLPPEPDAEPDAQADAQRDENAMPGQEKATHVADLRIEAHLDC